MKFFSKRVCAVLLLIAMLLSAAGCTKRSEAPTQPEQIPAEETPEVPEETAEEAAAPETGEESAAEAEVAPADEAEEAPVPAEPAEEEPAAEPEPVVAMPAESEALPETAAEEKPAESVPSVPSVELTEQSKLLKKIIRNSQRVVYYGTAEITDGDYYTGLDFLPDELMTVYCETPFRYVYLTWWEPPCPYYIKLGKTDFMTNIITFNEEKTLTRGDRGVLHDLVRLPEDSSFAYLVTAGEARLCDIRVFTDGQLPDDVQQWEFPEEPADALIFADRSGDETAYFGAAAALLAEKNASVQFCYLFREFDLRAHEQLNVLWSLGVRRYPVFGPFSNAFVKDMERAEEVYDHEDLLEWQVSMLRQYRPLVVLGHDRLGENGDFTHILSAAALEEAVELAGDSSFRTGDAEVWEVPKLYLHMAEENEIFLDVETPLSRFGGKTALKTAKTAYAAYTRSAYEHRDLFNVSAAPGTPLKETDPRFDCRRFGLVRSLVGEDSGSGLLEHTENCR